ncbi:MAG: site-2 protease family protein [Candidatus Aminicenantes bacterium]|jgi:Zn-dependent protease|nr:site-2 protease family protein [Candidatus Aminicenantes bacterium]
MDVPSIIILVFSFLFALTVHEASHAWAAYKLGDPTAYSMGRVSLNPLVHIDPIGTVIFPFIMLIMGLVPIGWAKPVPVNPLNLRNPRRDNLWISAAGPASNLTVATISLILIVFLKLINPNVVYFLRANLSQMGGFSRGFYPLGVLALILYFMAYVNCLLAIFNLIPIPPLDGSGVLMGFLSEEAIQKYERIRPFGFLILLALIYLGILRILMMPVFIVINAIALS